MSDAENILNAIDYASEAQQQAEALTATSVEDIAKLVRSIAANEVTFEIESAASLDQLVTLDETARAIALGRTSLTDTIEVAICQAKDGYRARHLQAQLRAQLVSEVDITDA